MARPLRIEYPGAWYHVMNRGAGRKRIFNTDGHYELFLTLLEEVTTRFGAEVHAYCLMGNHYHLLLHTPEGNLQRIMRHLNGVYTQRYNRMMRTDGPLFRGRYKAILVDADHYLLNLSRYIHRNPLEAKLVKRLYTYPWSSYPAYIGKQKVPDWLHTTHTMEQVSGPRGSRDSYRAFTEGESETELDKLYTGKDLPPVLGSETFIKNIMARHGSSGRDREIPDGKRARHVPSSGRIIRAVSEYFKVSRASITMSRPGRHPGINYPRLIAMYLCQQVCGMSLKDIARTFHVGHYASISNAIGQLRRVMQDDKRLVVKVKHLTQDLTH